VAVVTDTFLPTISRTVFLKPQDMVREFTPVPRAILNFSVSAGVVSAKPLNDTQETQVSIVLPFEFAYRLVDLTQTVLQDVANDWGSIPYLEVLNGVRRIAQGTVMRFPWNLVDGFQTGGVELNMVRPIDGRGAPRVILQSILPRVSPVITFKAFNPNTPAGAAGTLDFFAAFLEYDIEQVERFPIHFPVTTYER